MVANPVDLVVEVVPLPVGPACLQPLFLTREPMPPVGKGAGRDDRRVVRPVLEQCPVPLQQPGQLRFPVGLVAGEQDLVMRPRHRVDAVHLYEAEPVDQIAQLRLPEAPRGSFGQALQVQEDPAQVGSGDLQHHWRISPPPRRPPAGPSHRPAGPASPAPPPPFPRGRHGAPFPSSSPRWTPARRPATRFVPPSPQQLR